MAVGKDYKKGDPVKGAAILVLTMERKGTTPQLSERLLKETFKDLGVKKKQVERYLRKHRKELTDMLKDLDLK